MIVITDGFTIGNEAARQMADVVQDGLRQSHEQSLLVDAFDLHVLFADQDVPSIELLLGAIIIIVQPPLHAGLLDGIEQLWQNPR